jgi:hypothetical protein
VPPLLGDFDNDGDVDGRDFLVWQRGESPDPLSSSDLAEWQANYSGGSPLSTSFSVPEPASPCGMICALIAAITTGGRSMRAETSHCPANVFFQQILPRYESAWPNHLLAIPGKNAALQCKAALGSLPNRGPHCELQDSIRNLNR